MKINANFAMAKHPFECIALSIGFPVMIAFTVNYSMVIRLKFCDLKNCYRRAIFKKE